MKRRLFSLFATLLSLYPMVSRAQWAADGVALSAALSNQTVPQAVADGAGGAIVTFADTRSGDADIYAQRVDGNGVVLWHPQNGVSVRIATNNQTDPRIVTDGAGGAIIAWVEGRNNGTSDINAQRIDGNGTSMWNVNSVVICGASNNQISISAIPDGSGGAIFAWQDARGGSFGVADIYAQRVDASGIVQWTTDGVAVCTAANEQSQPVLVSDGSGGAIIAWADARGGSTHDIYARRVTSTGSLQWAADGVAVCTASNEQESPAVATDGSGGAVITWTDTRVGLADIYAQRVNGSGVMQWTADGLTVCSAANAQNDPQILPDNSGGTFVLWNDARDSGTTDVDIYAQRLDASGSSQWTAGGVAVCTASNSQTFARMTPDGNGGVVAAWMDTRSGGLSYDIYAQRIKPNGAMLWTGDGVAMCTAMNGQYSPTIVSDGFGGAIVAWQDLRSGSTFDIYANRITQGGAIPTGVGDTPVAQLLRVGEAYPNPFSAGTAFDVTAPRNAELTAEVFDVVGRRVRSFRIAPTGAGTKQLSFNGRDDRERPLPSGVYFLRVRAANEVITRKLVIER